MAVVHLGILKIWGVCVCLWLSESKVGFQSLCGSQSAEKKPRMPVCTCIRSVQVLLFYTVRRPFPGDRGGVNKSCCSVFKETFMWTWCSEMIDCASVSFAHRREMTNSAHSSVFEFVCASLSAAHIHRRHFLIYCCNPAEGKSGPLVKGNLVIGLNFQTRCGQVKCFLFLSL